MRRTKKKKRRVRKKRGRRKTMPTRIIKRPKDLTLKPPAEDVEGQELSFDRFVSVHLLNQKVWGVNRKSARMADAIEQACLTSNHEPGAPIRLAEEDWEKLKQCADDPKDGYGLLPWAVRQCLPYIDAIVLAEVEKPKPAEADVAAREEEPPEEG